MTTDMRKHMRQCKRRNLERFVAKQFPGLAIRERTQVVDAAVLELTRIGWGKALRKEVNP